MKKTRVIFALLIVLVLIILSFKGPQKLDFYIFEEISECEDLVSCANGATIQKFDSPSDENLKNLKYQDFFSAKYESADLTFEINAYVFDSSATAKKYFENITGKSLDLETNFLATGGMTKFKVTVIDQEKAYHIETNRNQAKELERVFDYNLYESMFMFNRNTGIRFAYNQNDGILIDNCINNDIIFLI